LDGEEDEVIALLPMEMVAYNETDTKSPFCRAKIELLHRVQFDKRAIASTEK
jgi:hypothetical protein